MIEVVIAITLLVIVMIPFSDAFITSLSATNDAHMKEVATMVADSVIDQARAINATHYGGTNLVVGRQPTAVTAEWNSPPAGLSDTTGILSNTTPASDSNSADTIPTLPTTAQTETVGGQTFKYYIFVGTCYEPSYTTTGQNTCNNSQTGFQMYRVIVDVTWAAPRGGCGTSGCYYVASTLISGTTDPAFDLNPVIPYITSVNTATFTVGGAGTFQVTTTGFPPPTYTDASYGNGNCTASTLPTGSTAVTLTSYGLLSGTPGAQSGSTTVAGNYTICLNATNTDGTGTQTLTLTVVKATPSITDVGPTTSTVGAAIPASSLSATFASGYFPTGGSPPAGGTVSFTVFGPSTTPPTTCTTGGTSLGTATANGNNVHPSLGFTPVLSGDYWLYASYAGNINNYSVNNCSTINDFVVGATSPAITATGPGAGTTGTPITTASIGATLSGGYSATGTVTFTVFGPQGGAPITCSTGGTTVGTASVPGTSPYHPSSAFTPTAPGTYWWYTSYSGDANNNSATSTCASTMAKTVVTGNYITALTATGPSSSGTVGTPIPAGSIKAALSGASTSSTGTITFKVFGPSGTAPSCGTGGTQVGTGTTVSGNNTYQPTAAFTPTVAGVYWWYASYGGDSNDNSAASTCGSAMAQTTVGALSPAITAAGPSSGTTGTPILGPSISATLSSGYSPTGTVTFTVFGPTVLTGYPSTCGTGGTTVGTATVSGNGSYSSNGSFTPPAPGYYWWYASYGGDTNNNMANSVCGSSMSETVVTGKASPTLLLTAPGTGTIHSAIVASSVTATLGGGYLPTGTNALSFYVVAQAGAPTTCTGGTLVGTVNVTGDANYNPSASFTPATATNYWWYVKYSGDTNNNAATSSCTSMPETIVSNYSPTLTAIGPASGTVGAAITAGSISSALSGGYGTPSGTITFTVFGPQPSAPTTCTTGGTAVGTTPTTVSGNTTYHPGIPNFIPTSGGDYWWYASYSGDSSDIPASSACGATMSETVVPVTVVATASGSGSTSTVSATLAAIPAAGTQMLVLAYAQDSPTPTISSVAGAAVSSSTLITNVSANTGYNEWAYWATASGTSKTVSVTLSSSPNYLLVDVLVLSGSTTTSPVVQFQTHTGTSASPTATLASTPGGGDLEVVLNGAGGNSGVTKTTPSGWTQVSSAHSSSLDTGVSSYYTNSTASTSVAFPWTNSVIWATIAVELT